MNKIMEVNTTRITHCNTAAVAYLVPFSDPVPADGIGYSDQRLVLEATVEVPGGKTICNIRATAATPSC